MSTDVREVSTSTISHTEIVELEGYVRRVWPWEREPYELWTFADMLKTYGTTLVVLWHNVKHGFDALMIADCNRDMDGITTAINLMRTGLAEMHEEGKKLGLSRVFLVQVEQAHKLANMTSVDDTHHFSPLVATCDNLLHSFIAALAEHAFLMIPSTDKELYRQKEPIFGWQVESAIPEAKVDIAAAGRCYAVDEPTACVFHLMRAAEMGLRKLATTLDVTLTDKGQPCRVEDATWNKVLEGINDKIESSRRLAAGATKKDELRHYSEAADHCTYMRDIWRNDISHTGKPYIKSEAKVAMDRVRDFLTFCAQL